jgi:predicted metal-binding membrane protein
MLRSLLNHPRALLIVAVIFVFGLTWAYTLMGIGMPMSALKMTASGGAQVAGNMDPMAAMTWTPATALFVFMMWWMMMIAMMVPSAVPTVLLYAALNARHADDRDGVGVGSGPGTNILSGLFLAGYLGVWALFSLIATVTQWALADSGLLTPFMATSSGILAGGILVAAGIYQLSHLKRACLRHCWDPVTYLTRHWRKGPGGAFAMGVHHGAYCLGCCWALMGLLFVGGVMNVYWIAGIALYVLIEKTVLTNLWLCPVVGLGLVLWGGWGILGAAGAV